MDTRDGRIYTSDELEKLRDYPQIIDPYYLMPITPTPQQIRRMKVGRNEPCPCGSGLKFKKCHLGKPVHEHPELEAK